MDSQFSKYLEQVDPAIKEQLQQGMEGFKAWKQKEAEEAAARVKAEEQARGAAGSGKADDVDMGAPQAGPGPGAGQGTGAKPSKRAMQQEEVEGPAIKLEESIKVENLSPEDIQAVVDATRKRLTKKLRVG